MYNHHVCYCLCYIELLTKQILNEFIYDNIIKTMSYPYLFSIIISYNIVVLIRNTWNSDSDNLQL